MARLVRFLLSIALFLLANGVSSAFASTSFPPTIQAELGLSEPPPCTLCHRTDLGGLGTVVTPFGRTMMNRLGLTAANVGSLKAALAASKAQNLDSDGDGISDIDELQANMDPNVGASGEVAGLDVPLPETGCAFAVRSPLRGAGAFALAFLGLVLARRRARRIRSMLRVAALSGPSFAALAGCSVDARQLRFDASGGQAGAESQPLLHAGDGGSTDGAPEAGEGGAFVAQPPLVDGCLDLDGDGVADCSETLLKNGDFVRDVGDWTADAQSQLVWDAMNVAADLPSGSALLTAPSASESAAQHIATQCVPLPGRQLVTAYANVLTHDDQGTGGHAEVDVSFFDTADCAGSYVSSFSTPQPLDAASDEWLTLKAGSLSGPSTQSALVALTTFQLPSDTSFSARFDNVLLKKQAP